LGTSKKSGQKPNQFFRSVRKKVDIKMKKISLVLLLIFLLINCRWNRVYNNRKFRYKVQYPSGWIAINSGHNRKQEELFKKKIIEQGILMNYNYMDVVFCNPQSKPPIYEMISVKGEQSRYSFNNIKSELNMLEDLYVNQLLKEFDNVTDVHTTIENFKRGKFFKFDFTIVYKNEIYKAYYIIIPGKLFATYYVNGFCRIENANDFQEYLKDVLNSFKKY
jgi:hypothetical protein